MLFLSCSDYDMNPLGKAEGHRNHTEHLKNTFLLAVYIIEEFVADAFRVVETI